MWRVVSRRGFLALAGAVALAGVGCEAGISGGATTDRRLPMSPGYSAARNRESLLESLTGSSERYYLPAGDYEIDNGGEFLEIFGFSGRLECRGARWVFTDPRRRGVMFRECVGAFFHGMSITYRQAPDDRYGSQEAVAFYDCEDITVEDYRCELSPAAGLLFGECISPRVRRAVIRDTMADGLHFNNCRDARAVDITTENTGDDGLAFVNYGGREDLSGGRACHISVRNAGARGISVIGQRDITVEDFTVEGTQSSGITCAHERSYDTRTPSGVVFRRGVIRDAGRLEGEVNPHGITVYNYDHPGAGGFSAAFEEIEVLNPHQHGVQTVLEAGQVRLSRVVVKEAPGKGFDLAGGRIEVTRLRTVASGHTGIEVRGARSLSFERLAAVDSCRTSGEPWGIRLSADSVEGEEIVVKGPSGPGVMVGEPSDSGRIGTLRHGQPGFVMEISPGIVVDMVVEMEAS